MNTDPLLSELFQAADFTPNANQLAAILHDNGPLFLVAGPGSGKTRVLLWRTVNLIVVHGIAPERIFLSTFTEKAAKQLKDGLISLLGLVTNRTGRTFDLSKMYVGTVHSLCHRLIRDRQLSDGRSRVVAPAVVDALDQYFLVAAGGFWRAAVERLAHEGELPALRERINSEFEEGATPSKHKAVSNLLALFNRFSEENLQPEALLAQVGEDARSLVELYALYRDRLGSKRVDLALLQQAAYSALGGAAGENTPFDHVIVDEYQDTNAIQELLFFQLAAGSKNLCVVGDDDQALYRFRGATVENFVQFPERCVAKLSTAPRRIELATNYRSRDQIVGLYTQFMERADWSRPGGGSFRLHDKGIHAHRVDRGVAVVASTPGGPEEVAAELAGLIHGLIRKKRVADPNQIAVLFPSLKSVAVGRLQAALEQHGLKIYAPRAKRFLEAEEPTAVVGLLGMVLGRPPRDEEFNKGGYRDFHDWLDACGTAAHALVKSDARLAAFVKERQAELLTIRKDYASLVKAVEAKKWSLTAPYQPSIHKRALLSAGGLSDRGKRGIGTSYLDRIAEDRLTRGEPLSLQYILNRATSVDWGVLDIFYRLVGFDHFKAMFDLAEVGTDEGPVCNLALTSGYLARYIDTFPSVVTASAVESGVLQGTFYAGFLFALFRLGEGEYEDADDPFPKGRIPFLTVHQAKGLEFPVVVLGNVRPANRRVRRVEEIVRPFGRAGGEPLDRMGDFDAMRMFYVALSRAKNLLVLPHLVGAGQQVDPAFREILGGDIRRIPDLDIGAIPAAKEEIGDVARAFSYTGDYLGYLRCPRQYMLFRKYGFAPSRTQSMFFGSLVHQTIEDLHNRLIAARAEGAAP